MGDLCDRMIKNDMRRTEIEADADTDNLCSNYVAQLILRLRRLRNLVQNVRNDLCRQIWGGKNISDDYFWKFPTVFNICQFENHFYRLRSALVVRWISEAKSRKWKWDCHWQFWSKMMKMIKTRTFNSHRPGPRSEVCGARNEMMTPKALNSRSVLLSFPIIFELELIQKRFECDVVDRLLNLRVSRYPK